MTEKVAFTVQNGVARLTIDRPDKRNCLDIETVEGILAGTQAAKKDEAVRVLTLRGAGDVFSAGADLEMFLEAVEAGDRQTIDEAIGLLHESTRALEVLDIPVVAAIDGPALAGGIEFLLATDLRLATESAVIGDQHANYGLVAGAGGTQRLVRQIDTAIANELMFTGRHVTGTEAAEIGLVNRAVPEDEFEEELEALEETLATRSQAAAALTKRLMREGQAVPLEHGLALERHAVVEYYFSDDAKEGFRAFADNRTPEF